MAAPQTPEQIKEMAEAYEKLKELIEAQNKSVTDLTLAQQNQISQLKIYLSMLERGGNIYEKQKKLVEDQLKKLKESAQYKALESDEQKKVTSEYVEQIERLEKMAKARKKHFKDQEQQLKNIVKWRKELNKEIDRQLGGDDAAAKRLKEISEDRSNNFRRDFKDMKTWRELGDGALTGITSTGEEALKMFNNIEGSLAGLTLLMGTKFTMGTLRLEMQAMFKSLESGWFNYVKATGLSTEELKKTYISIIDPLDAVRDQLMDFKKEGLDPMAGIGITAPEASAAMQALTNNVSYFRQSWVKMNPEVAAFTGNLVAGLKKIGVALPTSTKSLDGFVKVFGQTPKIAAKSVKQLVNVADSLGINVNQSISDFNANMGNLAQWGDKAVEVFANLQAQAVATGSKVGDLVKITDRLDTFKGAAEAAQTFNAVIGDTVLSAADLAMATPSEKIDMLRDAMDRSGISFETANRRVKKIIATMLGTDVAGAARIFGSKEDFELAKKNMDTSAMSQDKLKKRIHDSMNTMERMKASLSNMAGGMFKIMGKVRGAAVQAANAVTNSFGSLVKNTKDSQAAALQMLGIFRAFDIPIVSAASRIKAFGDIVIDQLKSMGIDLTSADQKKLLKRLESPAVMRKLELAGRTGLPEVRTADAGRGEAERGARGAGSPGAPVVSDVATTINLNVDGTEFAQKMGKIAVAVVDDKIRTAVWSANA